MSNNTDEHRSLGCRSVRLWARRPHPTLLHLRLHPACLRHPPLSKTMGSPQFNFTLGGDPLNLDTIRGILTRLEDTIIFALIERAQFAHNPKAYERGAFQELKDIGFEGSWLEWFLKETETFQGECSG